MKTSEDEFDERVKRFMKESGWDKLTREELARVVSVQLEALVEQGKVEQLVGEDGEFYYKSKK
tara:strand:+ start:138 stop:326 length:189 start_codon:yes stop_codon:yes gene_type:complete